jgi:DNA-binding helix-hairpin-helix protein with protein kinase domain
MTRIKIKTMIETLNQPVKVSLSYIKNMFSRVWGSTQNHKNLLEHQINQRRQIFSHWKGNYLQVEH